MAVRPETYSIPAYCRLNRSQGQGQAPPRADTALSPGVPEEVPVSVLVIAIYVSFTDVHGLIVEKTYH